MFYKKRHKLPLNRALRIMLATNALILIAGAMLAPIYAIYVEKIGGDLLDASFAGGIYALVASITVFLFGKISDKIKQKELVIVVGYLIVALGFFGFIFVNNVWQLLIVQAIIGFGEAIYSPAFDAVYSQHLNNDKAATQWGAWEAMNYFTISAGAFVGGYIAYLLGFNFLFIVMGVISVASAFYILFLPREIL